MKTITMLGIGGIGMSALAQLYLHQGHHVIGVDAVTSPVSELLQKKGVTFYIESEAPDHEELFVDDMVVYSFALSEDHPLLVAARERGIPTLSYAEAVGQATEGKNLICICGTHGKTTTTAMLAKVMIEAGFDPTVIVGATVDQLGGTNFRAGNSDWVILESCEYRLAFHNYKPTHIIATNIEPDHLDYFGDGDHYYAAFEQFFKKLPQDGSLTVLDDDKKSTELAHVSGVSTLHAPLQTDLPVGIPGAHNKANASLVFAFATSIGIQETMIKDSLETFHGTSRRFEMKGVMPGGALLYDDYAHHPTEIRATLSALKETYPDKKRIAVFQPHQFSRTALFLDEFAQSFEDADEIIIPNIYQVRDSAESLAKVSAESLVEQIKKHHENVVLGQGLRECIPLLQDRDNDSSVIMLMGAGNITSLAAELL